MSCGCFGASTSKKKRSSRGPQTIDGVPLDNIGHFSEQELRQATDNYDSRNRVGRGGFGTVYQGTLKDGRVVAVKSLSAGSKQGVHEFLTEIKTISNVRHPNLVELVGCCVQGPNRILVYEYVENNSLDHALLGTRNNNIKLDWSKRSAICLGTAKDDITHISTRIAGTTGYLAPEYALGGQLTMKADVYSFGVLIFEIISGKSSARTNWGGTQKFLLEWAWQLYKEGRILELVDSEMGDFPEEEVIKYMKVALFCTQAAAGRRPLMSQVVDMLSRNIRLNEKELTAPGFFQDSGLFSGEPSLKQSSNGSTSYQTSSVTVSITEVTPR
ncbi:hypothetical protein L6164_036641 [Bauhinia variegata]|uniref:Uncharacterized protein n=1 Tax=Bauhinia variegata TaxID=167791 RepID=A0ACB9KHP1_BAUVA|nr:hypothetical protein L6164_036641 [Bauhinia variegata]